MSAALPQKSLSIFSGTAGGEKESFWILLDCSFLIQDSLPSCTLSATTKRAGRERKGTIVRRSAKGVWLLFLALALVGLSAVSRAQTPPDPKPAEQEKAE